MEYGLIGYVLTGEQVETTGDIRADIVGDRVRFMYKAFDGSEEIAAWNMQVLRIKIRQVHPRAQLLFA